MILWSIQHRQAYEKMIQRGTLRADEAHLLFGGNFKDAYNWMAEQMGKRIGPPPKGVKVPIWAWYQWEGKRKRPDMRTHGCASEKKVPIVLLTIDVPENHVLLSDFDYWHVVLNDGDLIEPFSIDKIYLQDMKRKSWENIFDIERLYDGETHRDFSTQATLWEIKQEWVIKAEYFRTH